MKWTWSIAILGLGGCSSTHFPRAALTQAEVVRGCPLGVPGGVVTTERTEEGMALLFTSQDHPGVMRVRAREAAAQHGPGQHVGRGHNGAHGHGGDHGLQLMQMPAAHSIATDIEGGARVRFEAVDPAEAEALRAKLQARAAAMNNAICK